jgi:hypothetical protein
MTQSKIMPLEPDSQELLDKYIIDFRQSIVLVKDNTNTENYFDKYRATLKIKEKIVYLDFKNISCVKELIEQLLEQYTKFIANDIEVTLPEDDYRALDYTLELFSSVDKIDKNIVIWMENFTDILLLNEDWLFGLLRGTFEHHENIVHVFTSDSKDKVNSIFYNGDNPFFRFARILHI